MFSGFAPEEAVLVFIDEIVLLLVIILMVFPTRMGPHPSNSRCLTVSGRSAQYERGSMVVGGIELEILEPTEEKKLLKELATSLLSVMRVPLVQSSEILCEFLLRLAASFRMFQELLEFCRQLEIVHNIEL